MNSLAMLLDLICLSETKPKNHSSTNAFLLEYAPRSSAYSGKRWCIGAYVPENFSATVQGKNLLQFNCEDLWLQIINKSSPEIFNLGIIYHHQKFCFDT